MSDRYKDCTHCGATYGLHHYETLQCPVGGTEAPIGRKQEWMSSTFEADDSGLEAIIAAQAERIKALESTCQFIVNNRDKFEEHDPDGVKKATISFLDLQLAQKGGGNG